MPKKNQGKSKRPPQQKKQKKGRKKNPKPDGGLLMSECAARYAIAIASPWDQGAVQACVPNTSRPTYKVTAYARGVLTVGTGGHGYVCVAPTLAKNSPAYYYSGSEWANDTFLATTVLTAGVNVGYLNNLPYNKAALLDTNAATDLPEICGRIVSCALSVRYIGTELHRGGQIVCFSDPAHDSINLLDYATITSRREANIEIPTADREKCWVVAYGISEEEREFADSTHTDSVNTETIQRCYPFSRGTATGSTGLDVAIGIPIMGALISGVAGTHYEFNIVQHVEFIGAPCDPFLTPNMADPAGTGLVVSAANELAMMKAAAPKVPIKKLMLRGLEYQAARVGMASLKKGGMMAMAALI